MDPEKVVKGRLTDFKHMNDHHVYDWTDEADIPKGTKIETSRWCDGCVVVQQCNVVNRDDVH